MKGFKGQVRQNYATNYASNFSLHVNMLRNAGAIPSDLTNQQAEVILMRATELGVSPTTALSEIRIKEGKTIVSFELFRSLVHRSGLLAFENRTENRNECFVSLMHINGKVEQATFTTAEADKLNLLNKKSWKQNKAEMLYQRAYMRVARRLFPEISLGIIIEDEFVKTPSFFQKVWKLLLSFRKSNKMKMRLIKVSLSQQEPELLASTSENTGVARILAKKAVQLSKEQSQANPQPKVVKAS
jgi:hypothetical protein